MPSSRRTISPPGRAGIDSPPPLGLLGFGLTALLVHLNGAGLFLLDSLVLGIGILYGGVWQIAVGLWEWRKGRPFGASALTSLGFFWLALLPLTVFPGAGIGNEPSPLAFAPFLVFWGLFTLGLAAGALPLGPLLPVLFATAALSFLFQGAGIATGHSVLLSLGSYSGLLSALIALFVSAIQFADMMAGRPVTTFGWPRRA